LVKEGGEENIVTISSSASSGTLSVRLRSAPVFFIDDITMWSRRDWTYQGITEEIEALEVDEKTEEGTEAAEDKEM
jgi:hypothetical protein